MPNEEQLKEILLGALKVAFENSCRRSESNVKWTSSDQRAHESIKNALIDAGRLIR